MCQKLCSKFEIYKTVSQKIKKKWRHIVTIPFHFEINVLRVFQLAWITNYATLKIKGDLVIKHATIYTYISAHFSWTHLNYSLLVL